MKILPIEFPIEGIEGTLELREPSVSAVRPFLTLMGEDTQGFLLEVLNVSVYADGVLVDNALEKIGLSILSELTPMITTLLGFDEEKKD